MSSTERDTCPVGIRNEEHIARLQETTTLALNRLDEKLTELAKTINSGFESINSRMDKIEGNLEILERSLPNKIDERLKQKKNTLAGDAWKWIFVTLGGAIILSVVPKMVGVWIGL